MILRALHLSNVRKFTAKRASITGIGNGITVVSEANEFGKSTFFDAIHALFFEKYSSSARAVKSLQPYAGGAVVIAADVETEKGAFRVEKRFLSKKAAKIMRLSDLVSIAQDDEAERWIADLLGSSSNGPAGLLWVRQGLLGLEADSAKEKLQLMETRRDLLSSVAGEIDTMTGGRRMDRVMRAVAETLSEITTKTGRKSGPWKQASDAAEQLESDLASVTAQALVLEKALGDRKQAEASAKRLDKPEAKARREQALSAANAAMERARAHSVAVNAARQEHDLAKLKAKSAQAELDGFLKAIDTFGAASKRARESLALAEDAKAEAERLRDILDIAKATHRAANEAVEAARRQLDAARAQLSARKAGEQVRALADQITKAQKALGDRDAARAVVKASEATPDWLQSVEAAQAELSRLSAAVQAQTTSLSMDYSSAARITLNGEVLPEDQPAALEGVAHLDLPGLGRMTIHAKAKDSDHIALLEAAQGTLKENLSLAGALNIQQARALAQARVEAINEASLAQAILDTLAPNGIDTLRAAKSEADLAAAGASDAELPSIGALDMALSEAQELERAAREKAGGAEADHTAARETAAKLYATSEAAQQAAERAEADAGPDETRKPRRAEHLRAQAQEHEQLEQTEAALAAILADAPDLETAAAELKRAEDAAAASVLERTQLGERLAALSSEIRTLAGNGIEERRDELAGELEAMRASDARYGAKVAALTRLQAALDAERDAARDTYFGPVQEELKPLLSILHRSAALSFDSDSLLPNGLMRNAEQETLEDLSGGTQEQIAILTRLAFARLFARQGRHMPIILDDALVYSDDERIIKMFTALTRVAQDQQILVFSWRQLAFQDLGGARATIELVDL